MQFAHILIVCQGNICRSPMAEYFLKKIRPDLQIVSAGIMGLIEHGADDKAMISMQQEDIDLQNHKSQKLNLALIKNADLILVMSTDQKQYIEKTWPFAKGKVFRLGHWRDIDIVDPYQQNQAVFNETCRLIKYCVDDWKNAI
ncbi:low molecular weight protein-tyrosine-phosphatase [Acinetobacter equi]|uniref:protein-tyrosine-phosphatase n=1 Tax=Acinetobacter equi TaxID=1324350 RepID=A0A0N9VZJ4_9GAMM|nr:low molecular weight protein-tyrosine-phosphatase [Acinetobacter equi]ALH94720.1 protein tyrosine phosphatase [Acinetobacter equi]